MFKEIISQELLELLMDLQQKPTLGHFSLGGGTALALHLNHRESADIDLFTLRPILYDRLKRFLDESYRGQIRYTSEGDDSDFIHSFIKNIKVAFLCYKQVFIEEPKTIEGIKILGLKDISALKLRAIVDRRNKAKDFADIYYLLKNNSLEEMFDWYKIKYGTKDITDVKKALLSYNKVKPEDWDMIKYANSTSTGEIKKTIYNHIQKYNKSHERTVNDRKSMIHGT
jgi:hypothetical protein